MTAAARAIGESRHFVANYWSETSNVDEVAVLNQYSPGTVLLRSLDGHGTIDGSIGWVVSRIGHAEHRPTKNR